MRRNPYETHWSEIVIGFLFITVVPIWISLWLAVTFGDPAARDDNVFRCIVEEQE